MRIVTIPAVVLSGLWLLASSCADEDPGELLTVAASTTAATTGSGGASSSVGGAGGAGGDASTTTTSASSGGQGGQGGTPEQPLHGCLSTTATDGTQSMLVNISLPGPPNQYCFRMSQGSELTFTIQDNAADHRYMGGEWDEANDITYPDASSPITPSCDVSPYDCSPMVTNPPYQMGFSGVFPWYCDKHRSTERGVIYVE